MCTRVWASTEVRVLTPLGLDLQVVVGCLAWVLGTELDSSIKNRTTS